MTLNWELSPLMRAIVDAAERMGGGGTDAELSREAASRGESGRDSDHAHFAKGYRELERRGILRRERVGERLCWWLTEEAWRERGHAGSAPGTAQIGLFA
jgi:hypothetical protein